MTDKVKPVLMSVIKGIDPNVLAADICSVQPMTSDAIANLYKEAKSREELKAEGYEPVSSLDLMWVKKEESDAGQV
jgi:hypothetical protein